VCFEPYVEVEVPKLSQSLLGAPNLSESETMFLPGKSSKVRMLKARVPDSNHAYILIYGKPIVHK
jgi:hypothetical protein